MRKMINIFIISIFSFLLFNFNITVTAEDNNDYYINYDVKSLDGKKVYTYQNGKEVWFFTNKEEYEDFMLRQNGFRVPWYTKVIGTSYKYHVFTAYHDLFPDWSKVSSYSVSNNYTINKTNSFTYNGFSVGYTIFYSQSGSKTIPADSNRYSRLAYFAYLKITEYKILPVIKLSYYKTFPSQYKAEVVKTYLEPKYK